MRRWSRERWMCHLTGLLSRPLPIVDISKTPLSSILSPSTYQKVVRGMHQVVPVLVRLNRINILVFGSILFLPVALTRPWIPLLGVISLLPPLCFTLFLSVDVLALLRRNYEFWFVSVLNMINWIGIGHIFGDFRAVVCVSFWLNSQNVISIDANYRTYQTTAKSIVMAGPSMLGLVFCCSYRLIVDSTYPSFAVGGLVLHWRQIVIFTASTLIIFMFKKMYAQVRRRRRRVRSRLRSNLGGDRHVISCVVLRARMRLAPAQHKQKLRLKNIVRHEPATALSTQQLRLGYYRSFLVDGRRVLLPQHYLERCLQPHIRVVLTQRNSNDMDIAATSFNTHHNTCSFRVYLFPVILLTQKDLLRLLTWKFDVVFSTAQATALALCLLDLLQWQVASSLAVFTWWLWFIWVIMLDALTPSVTQHLCLRKLALPVITMVLLIAASCAVVIVIDGEKLFKSRLLFTLSLPELGSYHEHTDALAVQRVVTIIGWNARIVLELALCDTNELMFICRRVEYTSSFLTTAGWGSTDKNNTLKAMVVEATSTRCYNP
ncbi:LOW QUALITY PROTEIN: hypothetical protein PHMEG_00026117 [Phytophthora megakarya]|uniref:Transmembrane protein n=1 Tax=Phytophthora megakarya TaxID=4795 RepID=A0A225VAC7_9STRA|nr:LOW QUALITY PROTEIN: hypothetical protein PHMEG_00026117 [Phytophthora megakarya]